MYKFGWTERMVGISLGVVGLMVGLVQGLLIRWINPRIGDRKSILYGLSLYAFGMLLYAFASQGWMMLVFTIPYCMGGICGPALQSVITKSVSSNEQGELQGALTSLMSATSIIGPPMMTQIPSPGKPPLQWECKIACRHHREKFASAVILLFRR